MKNKFCLCLVVVALLCLGIWNVYAQRSTSARQSWEYKSIVITRDIAPGAYGKLRSAGAWSAWVEASAAGIRTLPLPVSMPSKLKDLGDEGWKMVSATPFSSVASSDGSYAGFTDTAIYSFKRPK